MFEDYINEMVLVEKEKYWKDTTLKNYIKDTIESGYIDCSKLDYELTYILENLQKVDKLEQRINKAIELLEKQFPVCIMPNDMLIHGTEKAKVIEDLLKILKGEDK